MWTVSAADYTGYEQPTVDRPSIIRLLRPPSDDSRTIGDFSDAASLLKHTYFRGPGPGSSACGLCSMTVQPQPSRHRPRQLRLRPDRPTTTHLPTQSIPLSYINCFALSPRWPSHLLSLLLPQPYVYVYVEPYRSAIRSAWGSHLSVPLYHC